MKKFKLIINLDISKKTFDAARLLSDNPKVIEHPSFNQNKLVLLV